MRGLLILVCFAAQAASACPETIVPVDPSDPALKSAAWSAPLAYFRARRHSAALTAFRKTSLRLDAEVQKHFQPPTGKEPPNRLIQRWLQRHVYGSSPGLFIHGDRFTYPIVVWWAWAEAACRAGEYAEAAVALRRLTALRKDADPHLRSLVALRLGKTERARKLLAKAPPDGFLTPYLDGLIAAKDGKVDVARDRLGRAQAAADSPDRKSSVAQALGALTQTPGVK